MRPLAERAGYRWMVNELAILTPEWVTAVVAVVGVAAGAGGAYMRLGDRLDRLESQMAQAARTLTRLEDMVWSQFHPGQNPKGRDG